MSLTGSFSDMELRALEFYLGLDCLVMLLEGGAVGYKRGREILQQRGFYD